MIPLRGAMSRQLFSSSHLSPYPNTVKADHDTTAIEKTLERWLQAISTGSPNAVIELYTDQSILLPTFSKMVHTTYEERLRYFSFFTSLKNLKGIVEEQHPKIFDGIATNCGLYTFTFERSGKTVTTLARFSFTYIYKNGAWKIVSHHSSVLPNV